MINRGKLAGWGAAVAGLVYAALMAGCSVAQGKWRRAVGCGVVMVVLAAVIYVKLTY